MCPYRWSRQRSSRYLHQGIHIKVEPENNDNCGLHLTSAFDFEGPSLALAEEPQAYSLKNHTTVHTKKTLYIYMTIVVNHFLNNHSWKRINLFIQEINLIEVTFSMNASLKCPFG